MKSQFHVLQQIDDPGTPSVGSRRLRSLVAAAFMATPAICALSFFSEPAVAADAAAGSLDEIIVTAQRKSEKLQDVPIAVTAISANEATNLGIRDMKAVTFLTPSLVFDEASTYSLVHLRGLGTTYNNPGLEQNVAEYIDGVPLQVSLGGVFDVIDVDNVQILAGPQGTLYGRNATAGAILLNTANPTDKAEGHIAVEYGNLSHRQVDLVANLPINDQLKIRFAGRAMGQDGYITNEFNGRKLGERRDYLARLKVDWTPTDRVSVLFGSEYSREFNGAGGANQILEGPPSCQPCVTYGATVPKGFYQSNQNTYSPFYTSWMFDTLNVKVDLGDYKFSSLSGYRNQKLDSGLTDIDNTSADEFDFHTFLQNKTFSEELQFSSNYSGPVNFISGLFYLHDRQGYNNTLQGLNFGPLVINNQSYITTSSAAAFLEGYWNITSALKLTLGGRYNHDKKDVTSANNPDGIIAFGTPGFSEDASFSSFTPRAVLAYKTDYVSYYASFNKGFKSGGLVTPAFVPNAPVKAETIKSEELGAKFVGMGDRLHANFDIFYYTVDDLQVTSVVYPTGQLTNNAAGAKGYGSEFTGQFAVTSSLSVTAGASYTHARYTDYPGALIYVPGPGGVGWGTATANLQGVRLEDAPTFTADLSATQRFELPGNWSSSLTAAGRYTSEYDYLPDGGGPAHNSIQKAYGVANLTGYLIAPADKYRIGFYCNNCNGRQYDNFREVAAFGVFHTAALPRTYGMNFQYNF